MKKAFEISSQDNEVGTKKLKVLTTGNEKEEKELENKAKPMDTSCDCLQLVLDEVEGGKFNGYPQNEGKFCK